VGKTGHVQSNVDCGSRTATQGRNAGVSDSLLRVASAFVIGRKGNWSKVMEKSGPTAVVYADWEKGEFIAIGEYRMSKAEEISWRDKQTGRAMSAPILRHTIEFGSLGVSVSERVPEGRKLEDIKVVGLHKGDKVAVYLTELLTQKGMVSARGRLVNLTPRVQDKPNPVGGSAGR